MSTEKPRLTENQIDTLKCASTLIEMAHNEIDNAVTMIEEENLGDYIDPTDRSNLEAAMTGTHQAQREIRRTAENQDPYWEREDE